MTVSAEEVAPDWNLTVVAITAATNSVDLDIAELSHIEVRFGLHGQYSFCKSPSHHGWA